MTWLTNTGVSSGRLYWENKLGFFDIKGVKVPAAVSVFPRELYQAPAELDRAGLPEADLLQRGRPGQPLRRLAGAPALRRGAAQGVPVAPLGRTEMGGDGAPAGAFGPLKEIDAGDLTVALRRAGPGGGAGRPAPARLAVRHPQLRRGRADAGRRRLSGDRARTCAATVRPASARARRCATASRPRWRSTPSPCWTRWGSRKAIIAGFDWGARTAAIVAALWPERCKALVSVSGYLIGGREANKQPLPPVAELAWWYQFYFATERGRLGYDKYRREFARLIWQLASPKWNFDEDTFDRSANAFDNPDHVAIVIHNYRWRIGVADGEPQYDAAGGAPRPGSGDQRPDDHHGGRRERRSAPRRRGLSGEVHRPVCPPDRRRRRRAQPAPGSPARSPTR